MSDKKEATKLSIFLIKKNKFKKDIIKGRGYKFHNIKNSNYKECTIYIKKSEIHAPQWSSFFDEEIANLIGFQSSVSAVLILKPKGSNRYFALTFGHAGRFLLKDDAYEYRFGLFVTLNSVKESSIRCIDKKSWDTIQSHTRTQSGKEATVDKFGIDIEQDMLKSIVGTPEDLCFGGRMTGDDSLSVSVKKDLSGLKSLLLICEVRFKPPSSKNYQWINNIFIVKDSSKIDELNGLLRDEFDKKHDADLWLAIPEIVQWSDVTYFRFTCGKEHHSDINLKGFLSTVKEDDEVTLDLLERRRVLCNEGNKTLKSWPVLKCIYFQTKGKDKKIYIFNDAKWFSVNNNFVKNTDTKFNKIFDESKLVLPAYKNKNENEYNLKVSKNSKNSEKKYIECALLDNKTISYGGGHGKVEVCDLFSKKKHLIHVKINHGRSNVLSHLISQGVVSGHLIRTDREFRQEVIKKLPDKYKKLISDTRPGDNEFTIVFAIIDSSESKGLHLPFFSRVNMNNAYKMLTALGYNVELIKIKREPQNKGS